MKGALCHPLGVGALTPTLERIEPLSPFRTSAVQGELPANKACHQESFSG